MRRIGDSAHSSSVEPGPGRHSCRHRIAHLSLFSNRGSGGVDGQSLEAFAAQVDPQLDRLQSELKDETYQPQPVRQGKNPKAGEPGGVWKLGGPTIYYRGCPQALVNPFETIFETVF